jgi:hypothetical protein
VEVKDCPKRELETSGRTSHNFFDSLWMHKIVPFRIEVPTELTDVISVVVPRPQSPSMDMPAAKKTGSHLGFEGGSISELSRHRHELDKATERKVEAREVSAMAFKVRRR